VYVSSKNVKVDPFVFSGDFINLRSRGQLLEAFNGSGHRLLLTSIIMRICKQFIGIVYWHNKL
jgi:hypothetical protein